MKRWLTTLGLALCLSTVSLLAQTATPAAPWAVTLHRTHETGSEFPVYARPVIISAADSLGGLSMNAPS